MTPQDFDVYYDEGSENQNAAGLQVEKLAYLILPDRDAARTIRKEVREKAKEQCNDFEHNTAWDGNKSTRWIGFSELTRQCCQTMLLLPEHENPLAKPKLHQWARDSWAEAINALSFKKRQIFLYSVSFRRTPDTKHPLLAEKLAPNGLLAKKLTKDKRKQRNQIIADFKKLQEDTLKEVTASLRAYYTPPDTLTEASGR